MSKRSGDVEPDDSPGVVRRGPYGSEPMAERRVRMVEVALDLLKEGRADGFTVREMTRRAGVSATVLYNAFGDKEGLIAAAIKLFYQQLPVSRRRSSTDLSGVLDEFDDSNVVTLANPAYVRSLCDLYFSHTPSNEIYDAMNAVAVDTFLPWLNAAMLRGDTIDGIGPETISGILAGNRWHAISDWARGRISDAGFPVYSRLTFLVAAAGVTVGATRAEVDVALAALARRSGAP